VKVKFEKLSKAQLIEWIAYYEQQLSRMGVLYSWENGAKVDTEKRLLEMIRLFGRVDMEQEIKKAVIRKDLSEAQAKRILKRLERIKKSKGFKADVSYLLNRYPDVCIPFRYYPKKPTVKRIWAWKRRYLTVMNPDHPRWEKYKSLSWDVGGFLHHYWFDAICAGEPFIHVFDLGWYMRIDKLGRKIVCF
jgi:hypothetical protein